MKTKEELCLIKDGLFLLLGVLASTQQYERASKVETMISAIQYQIRYYGDEE